MKKLFRQEWKYYLFFLIATVCWLCLHGVIFREHPYIIRMRQNVGSELVDINWFIDFMELWAGGHCLYDLRIGAVVPILVSILLIKGSIFWIEKDSYGRDFFQMLPVKRVDRIRFHFIMDSLFIVFTLAIYGCFLYLYARHEFSMLEVELPWFGKSVAGLLVTDLCYLLFLLGVINFLECLFVNGASRFFGVISCMGLSSYIITWLFTKHESNGLLQKLFGFLFLQTAGNRTYSVGRPWLGVDSPWMRDPFEGWTHASLTPEIIYQGKPLEYTGGYTEMFSTLYDFSKISSYVWYVLAYTALAVILAGLSIWLFRKQELSKEGLYFSFAKYLFSALICGTFYLFLNENSNEIWHVVLSVTATVIIFILLVILMTPDSRERLFVKLQR